MDTMEQSPALQPTDYREIVRYLDEALAVFDRSRGVLNITELHTKSILGALRAEMQEMLETRRPFDR